MMITALSGTPGCGKSTVSKILAEKKYTVIDLNRFALENDCAVGYDENRDTKEIDIQMLDGFVKEHFSKEDIIIEGHLSHLLSVDQVIILRCDPLVLGERLKAKGWGEEKIKENVRAEILDVIKIEAHEEGYSVFEIDTTNKAPKDVAKKIEGIMKGKYVKPNIDWLEKYESLLFD